VLQQIWNGLTLGALYGLIAIGYTLIFGIIQVIFFAQGELSMLAAFAALGVLMLLAAKLPAGAVLLLAVVAAAAVSVGSGLLAERAALRPLRSAPRVKPLITSLGVSIVFQNLIMVGVGPQPFAFVTPVSFANYSALGVHFNSLEIVILLVLAAVVVVIHILLRRHRYGIAMKAIAQSRDGARLMGIQIDRTVVVAFVLSSHTAALAGVLMALYYGIAKFDMGFMPGIKGFTIAILGGIGNIYGALLAALLIGVSESIFAGYVSSDYRDLFVFAVLVLTLIVRPQGLLGEGK